MFESVVVLRHASAGDPAAWSDGDLARPLDPDGLTDALSLPDELASWPIDEIWTSPAIRCQHTVAAVAAHRRIPVFIAEWLWIGSDPAALADGLLKVGRSVLLCSHRQLLPDVFAALGEAPSAIEADRFALDKGAACGLRFRDGVIADVELVESRRPARLS